MKTKFNTIKYSAIEINKAIRYKTEYMVFLLEMVKIPSTEDTTTKREIDHGLYPFSMDWFKRYIKNDKKIYNIMIYRYIYICWLIVYTYVLLSNNNLFTAHIGLEPINM